MTQSPSHPLPDDLEAAIYDWHNGLRLHAVTADGPYWANTLRRARSIAVLGAGTGRVVAALRRADASRRLIAVDRSAARLARIPEQARAEVVLADFREVRLGGDPVDAAIFPYSAFQLLEDAASRRQAVRAAANLLVDGGQLAFDLSTNFDRRVEQTWTRALHGYCEELGTEVEEWECVHQEPGAMVMHRRFWVGSDYAGELVERWAHHSALGLPQLLAANGLALSQVDAGYGSVATHRRLYLALRVSAASLSA